MLTPHLGGATHETLLQGAEMIAAEIARFAADEPLVNVFNPELVAIGGGFGVAGFDLLLPAVRPAVVREALAPSGSELDIRRAELGFRAGLIGAALTVRDAEPGPGAEVVLRVPVEVAAWSR